MYNRRTGALEPLDIGCGLSAYRVAPICLPIGRRISRLHRRDSSALLLTGITRVATKAPVLLEEYGGRQWSR